MYQVRFKENWVFYLLVYMLLSTAVHYNPYPECLVLEHADGWWMSLLSGGGKDAEE